VLADDLLFATLDPTSRLLGLASGRRVILTDTVGFIQALPTELVEAFSATLEEVRRAHLLALVVDVAHPECEAQLRTVLATLADMGCDQPTLLVANKVDRVVDGRVDELAGRVVPETRANRPVVRGEAAEPPAEAVEAVEVDRAVS
jgi:GTP-binding protein HflX